MEVVSRFIPPFLITEDTGEVFAQLHARTQEADLHIRLNIARTGYLHSASAAISQRSLLYVAAGALFVTDQYLPLHFWLARFQQNDYD